jgi:hypothetical protein
VSRPRLAAGIFAALVSAWPAFAAAAPVVVTEFSGDKPKVLRERVVSALDKAGIELAPAKTPPITPNTDAGAIAAHARQNGVAAYVEGKATQKKAGWTLKLALRGSDGAVIDTFTFEGEKLPELMEAIDAGIQGPLTQKLMSAKAPEKPAEEEEPEAEPEEQPEPPGAPKDDAEAEPPAAGADVTADTGGAEPDSGSGAAQRPSVLELVPALGMFTRSFDYNQDVNQNLRDHEMSLAPLVGVRLRWYPAAHFTAASVSNLGIVGEYQRSITASSSTESGQDHSSSMQQFGIGVRWRFPFGRHEVGVSALYGRHDLKVDSGREVDAVAANGLPLNRDYVPDAGYIYARPALDARFAVDKIRFGFEVGYRAIQKTGELNNTQWFPQATVAAIDAGFFAGYALKPELIVFGGLDFVRYAHDMNSTVADLQLQRDVAGGAIDQSIAFRAGIEWRIPSPASAGRQSARSAGSDVN